MFYQRPYYAGIGSRATPQPILDLMTRLAKVLALEGYWLRSGHADGADLAFERGVDEVAPNRKQIWLPWDGFNGAPKWEDTDGWTFLVANDRDREIAAKFHPAWDRCSEAAKKLHTRNVGQVLGQWYQPHPSEDDPDPDYGGGAYDPYRGEAKSSFVVCWTKSGGPDGGTGQAIRIARAYGVPVRNLCDSKTREAAERFVDQKEDSR